jgi:hypothetical protein
VRERERKYWNKYSIEFVFLSRELRVFMWCFMD